MRFQVPLQFLLFAVFQTAPTAFAESQLQLGPATPFSWAGFIRTARFNSARPYVANTSPDFKIIDEIDYEALGKIKFHPDDALYAGSDVRYPISFFHLGKFNPKPVQMNVIRNGQSSPLLYSSSLFDMPTDSPARALGVNAGFAGFQIKADQSLPNWKTEDWIAFQGASYFRVIGDLHQYGISARGIAIDTASPSGKNEEFPDFTQFYFDQSPGAPVTVYALLDGPSVSGAYKFKIERTVGEVTEVEAWLFFRQGVERLGLSPLTSMYWYNAADKPIFADWRPAIHDSDGLEIWNGAGERLWRPLVNPRGTTTNAFLDNNPKGFGLMQRDRNPDHYKDGVLYEHRPSVWVEPIGNWGKGSVQLVEIPTDDEIHDNIVAMWVPAEPVQKDQQIHIQYRLHWSAEEPNWPVHVARVSSTQIGRGGNPGQPRPANSWRFAVEFAGGDLALVAPDTHLAAAVETPMGQLTKVFVEQVPGLVDHWRAVFDLEVEPDQMGPINLRVYLKDVTGQVSETWLYPFVPPAGSQSQ